MEKQTNNIGYVGYMGRVFTRNGLPDCSEQVLPYLNGSAPYLRNIGELEFLMTKAEAVLYSPRSNPAMARRVLNIYDFKADEFGNPAKIAQSTDLTGLNLTIKKGNDIRKMRLSDLAMALMRNLNYRRNHLEEELSMAAQRAGHA